MSRALARDRLGVPAVLFFVLAGVAPLTVAAGVIPTAYQTTGLTAIPAAFLVVAVILAVFCRRVRGDDAAHHQLGSLLCVRLARPRPPGRGRRRPGRSGRLHAACRSGLYGALGPAAAAEAAAHLGVHASWWAWALAAWAVDHCARPAPGGHHRLGARACC